MSESGPSNGEIIQIELVLDLILHVLAQDTEMKRRLAASIDKTAAMLAENGKSSAILQRLSKSLSPESAVE